MKYAVAGLLLAKVEGAGSELASWAPLTVLLGLFGAIVAALLVFGRTPPGHSRGVGLFLRIPDALERLTRIPGWAATAVGTSLFGLLTAGVGFYSDVAWHVALGRDEVLFTAPHTAIVIGLGLIFVGAALGTAVATLQRVPVGRRLAGLQVPWSMIPLFALGGAALLGFPLDELWHATYGIDVTMWSPTHMLMILGASFTGVAGWLALAESGVGARTSRWAAGTHAFAAWLTLQGLAASQGEFAFGVPQFQQLFHPVLVTVAAGFSFVAVRLVIGRWWGLGIAVVTAIMFIPGLEDGGPVETRDGGLYILSALAVEVVALVLGTDRRLRFAVTSGVAVGTVGLAGEWWWNQRAYQPWGTALLPDAVVLAVIAGVGAAILGTAYSRAQTGMPARPIPTAAIAAAWLVLVLALAWPLPRRVGEVDVALRIERTSEGMGLVHVSLDPSDAADGARWFQATSWQGGGLRLAEMEKVGAGEWVSAAPVPVDGRWKTMVRLHRGAEMMAVPVYLPADPEIGEPEIPAVDRVQRFEPEQGYLLREARPGNAWFAPTIYATLAAAIVAWMTAFSVAVQRISRRPALAANSAANPAAPGAPPGAAATTVAGRAR